MRYLLVLTLLACALAPELGGAPRAQAPRYTAALSDAQVHNREIIVEFTNPGHKTASAVMAATGVRSVSTLPLSYTTYQIVQVPAGRSYMDTLHALQANPDVRSAGPNVIKQASEVVPSDPRFLNGAATPENALETPYVRDSQWGLIVAGAPEAWETTTGSPGVVVAVLDTGVNFEQEDMLNRWWSNPEETPGNGQDDDANGLVDDVRGYDFGSDDSDATDPSGNDLSHGNACSLIIAAQMDNGFGMAGVAGGQSASGGVRIMPLRVGTDDVIEVSAEIAAIDYAIAHGARVISMSFGGVSGGDPEEDAIDRAAAANVLVFAAAGNFGRGNGDEIDLPAGFANCVSVAATSIYDDPGDIGIGNSTGVEAEHVAAYSKQGPENDIAAPGTHIIAALNSVSQYTLSSGLEFTGTSAATPVVAGLAALILSAAPERTAAQVRAIIEATAVDLGAPGPDDAFGAGRIDMAAALNAVGPAQPGDTTGDGRVTDADLAPILQRYGAEEGDANYSAAADANGDGVIDELDVFVVGRNFGEG